VEATYSNVTVQLGDGYKGWPEMAPFDGIITTAAPPEVPHLLIDQLAKRGRLLAPWHDLGSAVDRD
jgi:protein-L-isoaspartate(D-aspartate) O-methyltransferase